MTGGLVSTRNVPDDVEPGPAPVLPNPCSPWSAPSLALHCSSHEPSPSAIVPVVAASEVGTFEVIAGVEPAEFAQERFVSPVG